jgi:FSR family fosmidomycin resistance protein-like MFS transporter
MKWLFPLAARAPLSLVAALMLVRLADEWFTFFPAGAIAPIRDDIGLTYAQAGVVLAALPAGGILGHGFAVAADYVDRRVLAAGGALVQAACLTGFALADSFLLLVAVSFLWGTSTDAFVYGCEIALVDLYHDQLAPALARVNAFGAVGDLLGPLTLAAAAALGVGWRPVFLSAAVLMALYGLWLALQRFPPPRPPVSDEHTPLRGILAVLRDPRIILLALVSALFGVLDEPFWGFTIVYLEKVRETPAGVATLLVAVGVSGGLVGFLSVGSVSRRLAPRAVLLTFAAGVGVAVATLIAVPFVVIQAVSAFIFGFTGAVFYSVLQATILGMRPGQAGTTSAVVSTIGLLGIAFPPLVGAVSDAAGLTTGLMLYVLVPVIMLVLLVAGAPAVPSMTAPEQ